MRLASTTMIAAALLVGGVAAGAGPVLKTEQDKLSYGMGVFMARSFQRQGAEVDAGLMARGLEDGLTGQKLLLGEEELRATMTRFRAELERKKEVRRRPTAAEAKAQEETFLAENARKEGVVTLPSGLQYKVLRAGEGKKPADGDTVVCHYRGTLLDGSEFDSSYRRGRPATFELARMIPGWREALKLMPVGSRWQVFIPAKLAYGERGMRARRGKPAAIGPNATLVYEAELLEVRPRRGDRGDHATRTDAAPRPAAGPRGG